MITKSFLPEEAGCRLQPGLRGTARRSGCVAAEARRRSRSGEPPQQTAAAAKQRGAVWLAPADVRPVGTLVMLGNSRVRDGHVAVLRGMYLVAGQTWPVPGEDTWPIFIPPAPSDE
ncbi:uncharacterized protein A4U43_C09F6330 [Asparagus officinalis]|uniref:Uncharacterized protein n=1 Tax=Asparagus officinalis TaxID=4686 RepID=A0A5P1E7H9_ASPOF|nr:uncharacterized protein A4U43_C09F6320 [Asparagus officinalis]ONK57973.1 uncharacterized protein A4U43_C09F6330 [Asparagus officinalis]